ncbi:MAG: hypothetical protein AAF514_06495 [Verrucomicrobiota bacterium]
MDHDSDSKSTLPIRRKLFFLAIILGLFVLLILLLDGLIRVIDPPKKVGYQPDETFFVDLKPGVSKVYERTPANGGQAITWRTNSLRLRGPEPSNADFRILVVGDSNIQARFSSHEHTYCARLEAILNDDEADTRTYAVLNGGVIGFGPDQSYLRLRERIDELAPDLVLFHLFADNDAGDLVRNRLFRLGKSGGFEPTPQVTDPVWCEFYPNPIERWWRSSLFVRLQEKIRHQRRKKRDPSTRKGIVIEEEKKRVAEEYMGYLAGEAPISPFNDAYDYDIALDPGSGSAVHKIKLLSHLLRRVADLAKEKASPIVTIIQPSARDLTTNLKPGFSELIKAAPATYDPSNLTEGFARACDASGLKTLNLFGPFNRHTDPDSLFFGGTNDHWNDAGQDLAARETALFLRQNGLENH